MSRTNSTPDAEKSTNCLKGISRLSRCEVLAVINSLTMILSQGLDKDDLAALGSLLTALGDTISVFASLQEKSAQDS